MIIPGMVEWFLAIAKEPRLSDSVPLNSSSNASISAIMLFALIRRFFSVISASMRKDSPTSSPKPPGRRRSCRTVSRDSMKSPSRVAPRRSPASRAPEVMRKGTQGEKNLPVRNEQVKDRDPQDSQDSSQGVVLFARQGGQCPEQHKLYNPSPRMGIEEQGGHHAEGGDEKVPPGEKTLVPFL